MFNDKIVGAGYPKRITNRFNTEDLAEDVIENGRLVRMDTGELYEPSIEPQMKRSYSFKPYPTKFYKEKAKSAFRSVDNYLTDKAEKITTSPYDVQKVRMFLWNGDNTPKESLKKEFDVGAITGFPRVKTTSEQKKIMQMALKGKPLDEKNFMKIQQFIPHLHQIANLKHDIGLNRNRQMIYGTNNIGLNNTGSNFNIMDKFKYGNFSKTSTQPRMNIMDKFKSGNFMQKAQPQMNIMNKFKYGNFSKTSAPVSIMDKFRFGTFNNQQQDILSKFKNENFTQRTQTRMSIMDKFKFGDFVGNKLGLGGDMNNTENMTNKILNGSFANKRLNTSNNVAVFTKAKFGNFMTGTQTPDILNKFKFGNFNILHKSDNVNINKIFGDRFGKNEAVLDVATRGETSNTYEPKYEESETIDIPPQREHLSTPEWEKTKADVKRDIKTEVAKAKKKIQNEWKSAPTELKAAAGALGEAASKLGQKGQDWLKQRDAERAAQQIQAQKKPGIIERAGAWAGKQYEQYQKEKYAQAKQARAIRKAAAEQALGIQKAAEEQGLTAKSMKDMQDLMLRQQKSLLQDRFKSKLNALGDEFGKAKKEFRSSSENFQAISGFRKPGPMDIAMGPSSIPFGRNIHQLSNVSGPQQQGQQRGYNQGVMRQLIGGKMFKTPLQEQQMQLPAQQTMQPQMQEQQMPMQRMQEQQMPMQQQPVTQRQQSRGNVEMLPEYPYVPKEPKEAKIWITGLNEKFEWSNRSHKYVHYIRPEPKKEQYQQQYQQPQQYQQQVY